MKVSQVYELVNTVVGEVTGQTDLVKEDLSDLGMAADAVFNANAVDNYVKSLINHIGRVIFVDRVYDGSTIPIIRDGWEYGSVLQKVQMELLQATENDSWHLVNGQSYDVNVFHGPTATQKFWNHKLTFEIELSITTMQVKESFSSATQLAGFVNMIYTTIANSITVRMDELVKRVINDLIAKTIHSEFATAAEYVTKSGVRAVNLLYLYNTKYGTDLTPEKAYTNADFIRFASMQIGIISDRMTRINQVYNIGGKTRFTPKDRQTLILLSEFEKAAGVYLYSDTYHNEYVKLPQATTVPFFQGSGQDYNFSDVSSIHVTTSDGDDVNVSGVLGVLFDKDAAMVANQERRVTSNYNAKGEFTNMYYKNDVSLFNDTDEQAVVFFMAAP